MASRFSITTTTAGWICFVLNGTRLEGAPAGTTNRLYKNNGDGTFTDVTEKGRVSRALAKAWASAVADYDNDGFDDLFITVLRTQRPLSQQR